MLRRSGWSPRALRLEILHATPAPYEAQTEAAAGGTASQWMTRLADRSRAAVRDRRCPQT